MLYEFAPAPHYTTAHSCLAGPPHHVCRGCCANRRDSIGKAHNILCEVLFKSLTAPALNKWTKLFPVAAHVTLLGQIYELGPAVFKAEFGKDEETLQDTSSDEAPENKEIDMPINQIAKWRKLARKRNRRAMEFRNDKQALFVNLLWVVLAEGTMGIHWTLFKHAT